MIEKQIKPLVTTTNLCCELVPVCCSLIPLSVMSVPTLPGTPTVHHADLVPKNAPPEQFLATQICPKLSYQKLLLQYHAGTTTKSSIISFRIILTTHLWHFLSQCQARSHYKNTHHCNLKQVAGGKGGISCSWGSRRMDCSCRLDLQVSSLC